MKLSNIVTNSVKVKSSISLSLMFFLINNLIVIGSENKTEFIKNNHIYNEFEEAYFQNSIPFNSYDNLENQFKSFFGFYSYRSENSFYPDLSIINKSELLREIYKNKFNDMAINENIYNINK